jgi:hypothetical protein
LACRDYEARIISGSSDDPQFVKVDDILQQWGRLKNRFDLTLVKVEQIVASLSKIF